MIVRDVRYPAIDGLRWYAAFLVFFVHAGEPIRNILTVIAQMEHTTPHWLALRAVQIAKDGHHGVDIFFIISGFLMGRIIADRGSSFSYIGFLKARFWRIYPAFLTIYIICTAYFIWEYRWPFDPYSFFAGLFFLNAVKQLGIFQYNYVTWSLGFEFAFYMIIPFVVLIKSRPRSHVALAALIAAIVLIPDQYIRMKGLFVGYLISAWSDAEMKRFGAAIRLWPLLATYVGLVTLKRLDAVSYIFFYYSFLAIAGLMFIKVIFNDGLLNKVFRWPLLRILGTVSYSFYLIHPLCVSFTTQHILPLLRVHEMSAWLAVAAFVSGSLGLSLMASWLCWYLLERPYFAKPRSHRAIEHEPKAALPVGILPAILRQ